MEISLSHIYQSALTCAADGASYVEEFHEVPQHDNELANMKDATCPESILNFILEADKERKTQEDKLDARCKLGLPPDPRDWTPENVNAWLAWSSMTFDLGIPVNLNSKLNHFPLDGGTLAQWTPEDFCNFFGPHSGDLMYENFRRWLNVSPQSLQIQESLYDVQKDINRLEDIKYRLIDTMVAPAPFLKTDYGSNMSSPPLSPPVSDELVTHDFDINQSRCLVDEVSSTGYHPHSWYPQHYTYKGVFPSCEEDDIYPGGVGHHSPLLIDPERECSNELPAAPPIQQRLKRPRGRPRKPKPLKQKRSQPILYKFILRQLNNPSMQDVLEWVSKQSGVFRFHSARKEEFAEMWGRYKGNREQMTYQNMARALRNYTRGKTKIMERVKRKLHYKFCPDYIQ